MKHLTETVKLRQDGGVLLGEVEGDEACYIVVDTLCFIGNSGVSLRRWKYCVTSVFQQY